MTIDLVLPDRLELHAAHSLSNDGSPQEPIPHDPAIGRLVPIYLFLEDSFLRDRPLLNFRPMP